MELFKGQCTDGHVHRKQVLLDVRGVGAYIVNLAVSWGCEINVEAGVTRVGTVHSFGIGLGNSEPEPVGSVRYKQNRSGKRTRWHSSFHLCVATAARALLRSCRFVERFTWRGGAGCRTWPPVR
jgi:hypothetical protein